MFLHKNLCSGYSLESPCRGNSNEYHNIGVYGEMQHFLLFWIDRGSYTSAHVLFIDYIS